MDRSDGRSPRAYVGPVPFEVTSLDEAAGTVIESARRRWPIPIRLANAYCVSLAATDQEYRSILNGPGLNFPDGAPVAWVMRRSKARSRRPGRVRGPSLFELVLDRGRAFGLRHFFLGTSDQTLKELRARMGEKFPGLVVCGSYAPPYGPFSEEVLDVAASQISDCNADIVWVALGTPKQDFACARLSEFVERPCIGVGAAFDFSAGTQREAPVFMQRTGTEWLFRFAAEPRRLWRRYTLGNLKFLLSVGYFRFAGWR